MLEVLQAIATASALLFTGAALYINLVEHPARMRLDTRSAALQWAPSYDRATLLQAPLAISGCLAGLGVWWLDAGRGWLVGALLIGVVVPYTFIVVMPTNRHLLIPGRDLDSRETRMLLERWQRLHAVRTVLGAVASLAFLWQLLRP